MKNTATKYALSLLLIMQNSLVYSAPKEYKQASQPAQNSQRLETRTPSEEINFLHDLLCNIEYPSYWEDDAAELQTLIDDLPEQYVTLSANEFSDRLNSLQENIRYFELLATRDALAEAWLASPEGQGHRS